MDSQNVMKKSISFQHIFRNNITKFALIIELIVIFVVFQALTDRLFLSSANVTNLMMQGCTFAIIGTGMVLVMVGGYIDLSVGSVIGFLATFAATLEVKQKFGTVETILLTILCGLLIGAWHGYWIAYRNLPSFIATLAGMLIFKGLNLFVGEGISIGPISDSFSIFGSHYMPKLIFKDANFNDSSLFFTLLIIAIVIFLTVQNRFSKKKLSLQVPSIKKDIAKIVFITLAISIISSVLIKYKGIPISVVLLIILAAIITFISNRTSFGRSVYAIGGNRDAAKLSGISIERTTFKIFLLMGLVTSIASIVFLGRVGNATALSGQNYEFSAITGCIVGGTSTLGGSGTILGAIIGTFMMASLDNGMSLLNLGTTYQFIVKGLVLLLAVAIDIASKEK